MEKVARTLCSLMAAEIRVAVITVREKKTVNSPNHAFVVEQLHKMRVHGNV